MAKSGDRAIGSHQQRQHVESLGTVVGHKPCAWPGNILDFGGNLRTVPGPTVDQDLATRAERALMPQKARMRTGSDDPTPGVLDMDDVGYLITEGRTMKTNIPGVFASGDAQDADYRQAVTAAGTGCMAAIDAERFLAEHQESEKEKKGKSESA